MLSEACVREANREQMGPDWLDTEPPIKPTAISKSQRLQFKLCDKQLYNEAPWFWPTHAALQMLMIDHHICNICQNTSSVTFLPSCRFKSEQKKTSLSSSEKTPFRCESGLLRPIFTPLVGQRPLVVVVIIAAAEEEVRQSRGGGCDGWLSR